MSQHPPGESSVTIQTSAQSVSSTPSWFGEVTLMVHHLQRQGVLAEISEQGRFARRRFGRYKVIDFLAVLLGYAISGEPTLEAYARQYKADRGTKHHQERAPQVESICHILSQRSKTHIPSVEHICNPIGAWWYQKSRQSLDENTSPP